MSAHLCTDLGCRLCSLVRARGLGYRLPERHAEELRAMLVGAGPGSHAMAAIRFLDGIDPCAELAAYLGTLKPTRWYRR